jgi:RNA polymerase sigma factor (sigma-70 family)
LPHDGYDELWTAMKSLPAQQREAVAYHHLAGLPYAEIAEILGNSEAAARRASADGMKKLRAIYQGASR